METTVWSFSLADDSPDLSELTLEFFAECRNGRFRSVIGPTVLKEIARADEPKRASLLQLIRDVSPSIVPSQPDAERLAEEFVRVGAVPPSKPDDARHVADAFIARADMLVSWNFKHIASLKRAERFNAAALLSGFPNGLIITTPAEVLYDDETDEAIR